jgi:glycosyltransferase involved in cell wall biosynthesis
VIVCSYNGAQTLGYCLRALDSINYPDFEIILVDDGSTDPTDQVVEAWLTERNAHSARSGSEGVPGKRLPTFKSIRQSNMGLSAARNAGARAGER